MTQTRRRLRRRFPRPQWDVRKQCTTCKQEKTIARFDYRNDALKFARLKRVKGWRLVVKSEWEQ